PIVIAELYGLTPTGAGIKSNQRVDALFPESRRVVWIIYSRTGECRISFVNGIKGFTDLSPVQQVRAHCVSPVHVTPIPTIGVVLIEQMIFTIIIDQSIWIIDPAAHGRKMYLGPVTFAIHAILTGKSRISIYEIECWQWCVFRRLRTSGSVKGR